MGMALGMYIGAARAFPGRLTPASNELEKTEDLTPAQFRGGFGMRMPAPPVFIPRPPVVRPPVVRPPTPRVRIPSVVRPPIAGRPGLNWRLPGLRAVGATGRTAATQVRPRPGLTGLAARIPRTGLIGRGNRTAVRAPRVGIIRPADGRGVFRNRVGVTRSVVGYGRVLTTRGVRKFALPASRGAKQGGRLSKAANDNVPPGNGKDGQGMNSLPGVKITGVGERFLISGRQGALSAAIHKGASDLLRQRDRVAAARLLRGIRTNAYLYKKGYDRAPFAINRPIKRIVSGSARGFVRIVDNPTRAAGGFIMRERDLFHRSGRRLTAAELKEKFALNFTPKKIVDVKLPPGTNLILGYAAGVKGWGSGGGRQYFIDSRFSEREFRKIFAVRDGADL